MTLEQRLRDFPIHGLKAFEIKPEDHAMAVYMVLQSERGIFAKTLGLPKHVDPVEGYGYIQQSIDRYILTEKDSIAFP